MRLMEYQRTPDWVNGKDGKTPKAASVVIPAYNIRKSLYATILSLGQQTFPLEKFEVLIVDNDSDDGVLEMLKEARSTFSVKYYFQKREGRQVGKCRNIGIANAQADLVIFVDADCLCSSSLIERHVYRHSKRDSIVVIGEIRMLDQNGCIDKTIKIDLEKLRMNRLPTQATMKGKLRIYLYDWLQEVKRFGSAAVTYWLSGANSSVKLKHLLKVRGYDEKFDMHWGDEDAELGYRLEKIGLKTVVAHEAIIFHQWHPSTKSGVPIYNRILFLLKHPELTKVRMLMRKENEFYGKTIDDLKEMLKNEPEEIRNYIRKPY